MVLLTLITTGTMTLSPPNFLPPGRDDLVSEIAANEARTPQVTASV
ncbi:hypothetical protein KAURM247S_06219 [Kitasatospora aureofaciens]